MMNIFPGWLKFSGAEQVALSLHLTDTQCRWILATVEQKNKLHLKKLLANGGGTLRESVFGTSGGLVQEELSLVVRHVLSQIPKECPRPTHWVVCLPSKIAYFGEITVPQDDSDESIRFQIEDMLEAVAGSTDKGTSFDWQPKASLIDGSNALAVAAVDEQYIETVLQVSKDVKLKCIGITLSNVAALNGYLQMLPANVRNTACTFLMFGELQKNAVTLYVYSDGVLLSETTEPSMDGFSAVQAISAMERLVSNWTRDHVVSGNHSIQLIMGGALMTSKGIDLTIRRSSVLSEVWVEVNPKRELSSTWHSDVVPFGAMEEMPCA